MVLITIGPSGLDLYRPALTCELLATIPPPAVRTVRGQARGPDFQRSAQQPMPHAAARRLPRLLPLALTVALLGAALVLAFGGPAGAQAAPAKAEIDGTADNTWDPANVTVRPGGTVTFKVAGGATHPVVSGDGSKPEGDDKFDDSGCVLAKMTKVGDSCQVKFPKAGSYPYFCQIHVSLGMKGVVTVGASAGGATSTTAAGGEVGGSVVEPPSAAAPPSSGRPAIYWAGWGLFALGALLALLLVALYVRFWPGFTRPKS
jgi:plastocyanin